MHAAHYFQRTTKSLTMIISEAGDEITEPFGVDLYLVMHNYQGLFTHFFPLFNDSHVNFCSLPVEGMLFPFLV